ncbi:hypothetical protein PCASD_23321, partial [Puccinia coronata f. sp. avenae]
RADLIAIPSALGALCLNEPSLKKTVLEATLTFLSEIDRIRKAVDITASQVVNVQLKACVEESPQAAIKGASSSLLVAPSQTLANRRKKDEKHHYLNNLVLQLIDVACRLRESMLQNVAQYQDFITLGALKLLLVQEGEVPNQHFREQRPHRRRKDLAQATTTAAGSNRAPAGPEIDPIEPATFLAGLDPSFREAVLLKQDNGPIFPNLLAEVDTLRAPARLPVVQLGPSTQTAVNYLSAIRTPAANWSPRPEKGAFQALSLVSIFSVRRRPSFRLSTWKTLGLDWSPSTPSLGTPSSLSVQLTKILVQERQANLWLLVLLQKRQWTMLKHYNLSLPRSHNLTIRFSQLSSSSSLLDVSQ